MVKFIKSVLSNKLMKRKTSLWTIFWIALAGILFSGYLSFAELTIKTCPLGECTNVIGLPACVYGLVMYCVVFILAIIGIKSKK